MLRRHGPQIRTLSIITFIQISTLRIIISFHFPNFDFIRQERKTCKKGGGILIYLKNGIKFKIIKDLSISDGDNECATVEIENRNSKNLLIAYCYRWWCQSKLFRLQQKFRNSNVWQSNFCAWLHSFDNEINYSTIKNNFFNRKYFHKFYFWHLIEIQKGNH